MIYYNIVTLGSKSGYSTGIPELSGLCFSSDKSKLFAVSDTGKIYTISNLNGMISPSTVLEVYTTLLDLEGVTNLGKAPTYYVATDLIPDGKYIGDIKTEGTDILYLAVERDKTDDTPKSYIYKYDSTGLSKVGEVATTEANNGLEGIAKLTDNLLLLGNLKNPVSVKYYSLTRNKVSRSVDLSFTSEIADICYDADTQTTWILNSDEARIYICTNDFKQVLVILLDIDASLNPEALAVDFTNKIIWIGCDSENVNNIYKIPYTLELTGFKALYYVKQSIKKVMKQAKIVWSTITSCFGSGIWKESANWSETELWKD